MVYCKVFGVHAHVHDFSARARVAFAARSFRSYSFRAAASFAASTDHTDLYSALEGFDRSDSMDVTALVGSENFDRYEFIEASPVHESPRAEPNFVTAFTRSEALAALRVFSASAAHITSFTYHLSIARFTSATFDLSVSTAVFASFALITHASRSLLIFSCADFSSARTEFTVDSRSLPMLSNACIPSSHESDIRSSGETFAWLIQRFASDWRMVQRTRLSWDDSCEERSLFFSALKVSRLFLIP